MVAITSLEIGVKPSIGTILAPQAALEAGVYTLHDLRTICRKQDKHWCPYYLARHMMAFCNVIVYNYQYMLDPKARLEQSWSPM